MATKGHDIIVIGTSAGGLEALDTLIGLLPAGLASSIFIVQHMAPENTGAALLHRLSRHTGFVCKLAKDGEAIKPARIYIAPPDNHLLLKKNHVLVTKGARENRSRPGIDPLFRSAAVSHTSRVIGVVLTGMLDDGTAGLIAIKKCGGITVVQDPRDAAYPGMPNSALHNLIVDHCVPLGEMGRLLGTLARKRPGKTNSIPKDVRSEAEIAERVLSDVAEVNSLGKQVPYNCPNCGGVLWEMNSPVTPRYRCHTGHSFTLPALLESQSEKIEETLWIALRMFEERKNLLNSTDNTFAVQRAKETQIHIERIRAILLDPRTWQHTLDRVKKSMSATPKTKSVRDEEERQQNLRHASRTSSASKRKTASD
jgi:two-component system, chemotaxis family, protein-glutamate methylesterase/glutaminase